MPNIVSNSTSSRTTQYEVMLSATNAQSVLICMKHRPSTSKGSIQLHECPKTAPFLADKNCEPYHD